MTKLYIVYPKGAFDLWYEIEAPTKRIAKWCGLNVIQANYGCNYTIKDMVAERKREEE
jgi:hypothetical protein